MDKEQPQLQPQKQEAQKKQRKNGYKYKRPKDPYKDPSQGKKQTLQRVQSRYNAFSKARHAYNQDKYGSEDIDFNQGLGDDHNEDIDKFFPIRNNRTRVLTKLQVLGEKFLDQVGANSEQYANYTFEAKLNAALKDGLVSSIASLVAQHGPGLVKWAAPQALEYLKNTKTYQRAANKVRTFLHDTFGLNLNDPSVTQIKEFQTMLQPSIFSGWNKLNYNTNNQDDSYGPVTDDANSVNTSFLCQAILPTNIPPTRYPASQDSTTVVRYTESWDITTSNVGGWQLQLQQYRTIYQSATQTSVDRFCPLIIRNGSGFTPEVAALPYASDRKNPAIMSVLNTPDVMKQRVVGVIVQLTSTISPLNAQGRIIATSSSSLVNETQSCFLGLSHLVTTNDQLQQLCSVEQSIKSVNQLCLSTNPCHEAGFMLQNYQVAPLDYDQEGENIVISILGAPPNTVVGYVKITWIVEIIPKIANQILGGALQQGPPGMATGACLNEAFQQRPALRYIGLQERLELIKQIQSASQNQVIPFRSARNILAGLEYDSTYHVTGFGGIGQSQMGGGSGGIEPLNKVKTDKTSFDFNEEDWMNQFDSQFPQISQKKTQELLDILKQENPDPLFFINNVNNYLKPINQLIELPYSQEFKTHATNIYHQLAKNLRADNRLGIFFKEIATFDSFLNDRSKSTLIHNVLNVNHLNTMHVHNE